ncbi:MAG: hypothetical protein A2X55_09020 [Nitrospirae bacterium GWB2_47_37]|nr:MAG: hypothetical protein A2Z82_02520 [Nitrospirae bacterium GWA2_46_11]OGW23106.1 MAG: hypothetical protein A2X55_09020 [Nitrospirae bacterium GWB2_47_37]HAK87652.1 hypothetical protein [Nitrospiraceae bacterium]
MTTATTEAKGEKKGNALGAIWETSREGKTHLTGDIMEQKVVLVLNPKWSFWEIVRNEDKQPKYLVYPLIDKTESNAPADEKTDEAPVPVEKDAFLGDSDFITGTIKSVRKDRKGFCIGETWFRVDDGTELSGLSMDDARGKEVTVHYTPGNGDNANPVARRIVEA